MNAFLFFLLSSSDQLHKILNKKHIQVVSSVAPHLYQKNKGKYDELHSFKMQNCLKVSSILKILWLASSHQECGIVVCGDIRASMFVCLINFLSSFIHDTNSLIETVFFVPFTLHSTFMFTHTATKTITNNHNCCQNA